MAEGSEKKAVNGPESSGEMRAQEKGVAKFCPIMTAGNTSQSTFPGGAIQIKVPCMGPLCGIWNGRGCCGLIQGYPPASTGIGGGR